MNSDYYIVSREDLVSIADAIREKTGVNSSYAFPNDYAYRITGGGRYEDLLELRASNTLTSYENPDLTTLIANGFNGCTNLTSLKLYNLVTMSGTYPIGDTGCDAIVLPKVTTSGTYVLNVGTHTTKLDLTALSTIATNSFWGSSALNVLILRNTSLVTLGGTAAFTNTPFASGKAGGTLYVPSALVATYQSATNWSTILGYENNSIQAIEGSQYETKYADGTSIT